MLITRRGLGVPISVVKQRRRGLVCLTSIKTHCLVWLRLGCAFYCQTFVSVGGCCRNVVSSAVLTTNRNTIFVCLKTCLSICVCSCLQMFVCRSVWLCLLEDTLIGKSVCLSFSLVTCFHVCLSVGLSVFAYQKIYMLEGLFVCLSVLSFVSSSTC